MEKCNLNFLDVPFCKDTRIGKQEDTVEFLFGLTNKYVYLVLGRMINSEKNDPIILETINYYSILRKEEDSFSQGWYNFNILDNHYYPKYHIVSVACSTQHEKLYYFKVRFKKCIKLFFVYSYRQ